MSRREDDRERNGKKREAIKREELVEERNRREGKPE